MWGIKKLFSRKVLLLVFLLSGPMVHGEKPLLFYNSASDLHAAPVSPGNAFFGEKPTAENGENVDSPKKLTKRQIKKLTLSATQNPDARKVMLGRYIENSESSYNVKAGKEYTFFELKNWDEIYRQTGFEYEQMWRICEKFMENQLRDGKDFYFSHDPNAPKGRGFSMEVAYLKKKKKRIRFIRVEDNWKAVW